MTTHDHPPPAAPTIPPPSKHHLGVMIWLSVFPTLTVINLALGDWLEDALTGPSHVRARDHRRADRHLRPDAAHAPPASAADDDEGRARRFPAATVMLTASRVASIDVSLS